MLHFILTFISIMLAVKIVGISYTGWVALVVFTIILVIINRTVKPVIKFLTWPINFLTLGLFHIALNLGFLYLVSKLTPGFVLASLKETIIFALVLWIIQWLLFKLKI